ncbi:DUF2537 domain-containing protein [Goodfellowiella coeruleoviolacea]|uniref:DUF2537 domain-containing protein n=1 Tax=Goodfellowiella coeruleoviolacea TaxID=334858 RepID=A0AAE3GJ95_9PSEU|nr:DUF2537 domain-containing protein [Goodfellowiella coeruleoviolacea]MCP2169246.1 Protein of unknown function (DUF2537) [Goodfellowiella coeruleoviolacea]
MELRAKGGRAVLAGRSGSEVHEVDPRSLPLGSGLVDALHEWAKVAEAVRRAGQAAEGTAGALVGRRGRQLASRVAEVMRTPVAYTNPMNGEVAVVEVPPATPTPDRPRPDRPDQPGHADRSADQPTGTAGGGAAEAGAEDAASGQPPAGAWAVTQPAEPTPWGTGLTVSAFVAVIVVLTIVALSVGLAETSVLLALVANVLVVGGIAPSVWLARRVPVWRWVSYGVTAGVALAWLGLLLSLL